jgi:hypothetical protein
VRCYLNLVVRHVGHGSDWGGDVLSLAHLASATGTVIVAPVDQRSLFEAR